jgi:glutamate synthase domain-containing protein 3
LRTQGRRHGREERLRALAAGHVHETPSAHAGQIPENWDLERGRIWQIMFKDMLDLLDNTVRTDEGASVGSAADQRSGPAAGRPGLGET